MNDVQIILTLTPQEIADCAAKSLLMIRPSPPPEGSASAVDKLIAAAVDAYETLLQGDLDHKDQS